ncbi:MAG: Na+/H+ antiporter NhaC family protein [Cyanobacteria bacterium J06621_11]
MYNSPSDTDRPTDLIAVLLISFGLLITSAINGIFIAYPLLAALLLLIGILLRRGFSLKALLKMGLLGARQALPVVKVLLLIGIITAVWMAAGTVPALVYYGTGLVSGQFFLLWAFMLTGVISTLIGTSFGAVGTIGIALMVIARSSNAGESATVVAPVAGAIIAGAFLGDRCSPMSSSAHLVASITKTDLYTNLRNMVSSSLWPFIISVAFYTILSFIYPIQLTETPLTATLPNFFNLSPVVLIPAATIFLLAVLKVDVKIAMLASIGTSLPIAHSLQGYALTDLFQFSLFGYRLTQNTPLQSILLGGGLLPMAKATLVVFISTAFAGIFAGSQTLQFLSVWLNRIRTPKQLAQATTFVSILANLFGCTQTIAIVMTGQIMQPYYQNTNGQNTNVSPSQRETQSGLLNRPYGNEQLALAIEDTAVVIAPLIPWNIASLIPATILSVGPTFIPYAIYLLLLPLFVVIGSKPKSLRSQSPVLP